MNVLITSQYNSPNTYVKDIVDELLNDIEVVTEVQNFWTSNIQYDIIHIQWPEELFSWKRIEENDLRKLKNKLNFHKKNGSKIVVTLHNALPHTDNPLHQRLYDLVYHSADAIINLGKFSTSFYPNKLNIVIQHPNYEKHVSITETKNEKEYTFLSFGNIRNKEEELQIINGFIDAKIPNSKLIISSSIISQNPFFKEGKFSLRKWKYIYFLKTLKRKKIELLNKKLSSEEINFYFNQSDTIISPRINNLNSGVVFMGFTFGKIVIGPNIGNIGEILNKTNNPTFEPQNIKSISQAMKSSLNKIEVGKSNLIFSREFLSPYQIAKQHYDLYLQLLNN